MLALLANVTKQNQHNVHHLYARDDGRIVVI